MIYFNYSTDQGIQAAIDAKTQPKPQPKPATEADHTKLVAKIEKVIEKAKGK